MPAIRREGRHWLKLDMKAGTCDARLKDHADYQSDSRRREDRRQPCALPL
jgi:hypothetical protein